MVANKLLTGVMMVVAMAVTPRSATADVVYGNTTPFNAQAHHANDYALGVQVVIPTTITLESFGLMYGHESSSGVTSSNAIFGLYSSGGSGLPLNLLAVTNPINLNAQQTYDNIAFTSSPTISAGTYWMMALYESSGASPRYSNTAAGSLVAYWYSPYASGMPGTSSGVVTYTGQNFNYWVNGSTPEVPEPGSIVAMLSLVSFGSGVAGLRRRRGKQLTA